LLVGKVLRKEGLQDFYVHAFFQLRTGAKLCALKRRTLETQQKMLCLVKCLQLSMLMSLTARE
jgi:hypothetical protein